MKYKWDNSNNPSINKLPHIYKPTNQLVIPFKSFVKFSVAVWEKGPLNKTTRSLSIIYMDSEWRRTRDEMRGSWLKTTKS